MIFGRLILNMICRGGFFFRFFEILTFWAVTGEAGGGGGVKGQKLAKNEKQPLHVSGAISQEQYSI